MKALRADLARAAFLVGSSETMESCRNANTY